MLTRREEALKTSVICFVVPQHFHRDVAFGVMIHEVSWFSMTLYLSLRKQVDELKTLKADGASGKLENHFEEDSVEASSV